MASDLAAKCRVCGAFWAWQGGTHATPKDRARFAADIVKGGKFVLVEVTTEESRAGQWECEHHGAKKPDAIQEALCLT